MKKVLVGAMALLSLAACSNEEVLQKNEVKQEIGFTAVTGKATSRANTGYCNNKMPDNFRVWAKQGTKNYFAGQIFLRDGSTPTYKVPTDDPVRYWPESGTVDFFAAKDYEGNGTSSFTWDATNATEPAKVLGFTVPSVVANQKDFIYAVNMGATKPTGGATSADLNFRHALAQIVFKAKNENKNIYVEVSGVSVCQVSNKGDFSFPVVTTDGNIVDTGHGNPYDDPYTAGIKIGKWTLTPDTYESAYAVTFDAVGLNANQPAAQSLTYANGTIADPTAEYNENTMYLMPQKLTGDNIWDPSALPYAKPGDTAGKAYFLVKAKIWNIAVPNVADAAKGGCDTAKDIVVWGNTDAKNIAIPIPVNTIWEQGKKYVYTFTFTKAGEGGWDPDPTTPTHVLTPITLSVTVDDFAAEDKTDVEMKK